MIKIEVNTSELLGISDYPYNKEDNFMGTDWEVLHYVLPFMVAREDFYWEYSKKGVPYCKKETYGLSNLKDHFLGKTTLGFSPFIDNERIIFAAVDFDAHLSKDLTQEENNKLILEAKEDSEKVYTFLIKLKLPVIINSSGSEGRHVRVCCPGAKAEDMRIFMKWVLEQTLGDLDKHEIFPKQNKLEEGKPYGNQIKGFMGIHPKTKRRATIIKEGNVLDVQDSLKFLVELGQDSWNFEGLQMTEEDYDRIKDSDKAIKYIKKAKENKLKGYVVDDSVPKNCPFIEEVAAMEVLPSAGKYNRHACIDPNIASYGIEHPATQEKYAYSQGRSSSTAFDNWSKYWGDHPVFSCVQIIAYLEHNSKNNEVAKKGLKKCLACPNHKAFMLKNFKPKGWGKFLNIKKIAEQKEILNCPQCSNELIFYEDKSLFKCNSCKCVGGIRKLLKMKILENKQ